MSLFSKLFNPQQLFKTTQTISTGLFNFQALRFKSYKLKSHSGASKRFMKLGNGTFKRGVSGRSHLNIGTSGVKRAETRKPVITNNTQSKTLAKMLPH
ncbi:hypothetical protein CONCODRAFT_2361 [Conidiobolus coronatus NRRL 28638]|uniref:50S ribosomal protein L35 n=1 Tax=Conidiobolus coronatus (strain ATCC 28846 / CBS 209.66 / NRRL 28638) TaxID=796925 RepID=A0A137PHV8_CONC2|nr:hypothetical protein CONCODRAFT_2361 [Conidiobolus coronatus NRRL 28638]|eukprot:KXN74555.1 hypothetical protein CONCODRAFT_2361 [Conidiobolus coronatus NRRL 28638]